MDPVEFSREKVAKQGGSSFEYEPLPRTQTTSQKENDQVTCTSKRTEEREKKKKKKKRDPPETGRAAKELHRPVTCQFNTNVPVLRGVAGAVGAFAGDATWPVVSSLLGLVKAHSTF